MTLSYRSPHLQIAPDATRMVNPVTFTAEPPPITPPTNALGVEWLMAHVVDVISAGPVYENRLSPVWAQMVRLYAQYLGIVGRPRSPASPDDRSGRRKALERELAALVPAIADLMEKAEAEEREEDGAEDHAEDGDEAEAAAPPDQSPNQSPDSAPDRSSDLSSTVSPVPSAEQAAAYAASCDAYELYPLSRLDDAGVLREALGYQPDARTLHRVLKLALDASAQRAVHLRGPGAALSPSAIELADRMNRKWRPWFFPPPLNAQAVGGPPDLEGIYPDLFETPGQTWRRRLFPPDGKPPN